MLGKNLIQAAAGNAAGEALGIEDVFSTWLYTGNGSTQTITNGIDLAGEGGLVWAKSRSGAENNVLIDTVRGGSKLLYSNTTAAEQTPSAPLTFSSTGYSVSGNGAGNTSSTTYASWTFRKAPGFFDVVTYTGNGSNRTIAHSLGSVPGTIIVKRTDAAADWQVYHRSLANTEYMVLNSTAAKATGANRWNSTTPTSTVFSLGTDATVNASGGTYVAYLFAHDDQIFGEGGDQSVIKCGSYTTDSTGRATVELGWEPQWILTKSTDNANNWTILDTMRGFVNPSSSRLNDDALLYANTSGAESTAAGGFPTATGFAIDGSHGSANYIYIAIRRGPMKTPTDATKVFNALSATGTGAATTITTGFVTDLFFRKAATGVYLWTALDRLRNNAYLDTTATTAESTGVTAYASGLFANNTGFQIATGGTSVNGSSLTFSTYAFRRAPGFFDVVAYDRIITSTYAEIPHNLGVQPELIIVKERNDTSDWSVWATSLQKLGLLQTNLTFFSDNQNQFSSYFYDTQPTPTVFTVGTSSQTNTQGGTGGKYIAYLFATCPGVSKVGSYTGTGTTLNVDCGFTAGARFVLIKRTDSTGDWYVWDTARGIVSGNDPSLLLNSTAAEVTNTDYIDPLSSGFQISSTAPAALNASGGTFVFLAIS